MRSSRMIKVSSNDIFQFHKCFTNVAHIKVYKLCVPLSPKGCPNTEFSDPCAASIYIALGLHHDIISLCVEAETFLNVCVKAESFQIVFPLTAVVFISKSFQIVFPLAAVVFISTVHNSCVQGNGGKNMGGLG